MNQLPKSLTWLQCRMVDRRPNWCHITRLLADATPNQQQQLIQTLKTGRIVQLIDMDVEDLPMDPVSQLRLVHLTQFEQGGFQLASFQSNWALFSRDKHEYFSMNERLEWGWQPKPTIAIDKLNIPILTPDGKLLDVFVPLSQALANFIRPTF